MPPKYLIKTYGCQMNFADSEKLAGVLQNAGYFATRDPRLADIILINTCVVRQHAEDRAVGYITSLKGLKEKNQALKIALCGCIVTEPGRDVKKQFPHVDWFIPPNGATTLEKYLGRKQKVESRTQNTGKGLVNIMTGCDNFCSYCVVPYVRGREVSRPIDEVLAEIKGLLEQGVTDITLLGQNVNSYKYGLDNLLREIGKLFPLARGQRERGSGGEGCIGFLTSHPKNMSDEIIDTVAALPCVAKEFLLPLQSGDDEILHKMNRGYTFAYYAGRIKKIRALLPEARIMTDIMVGFPGETEEQFENSLQAVRQIKFNHVHMFAYSARPATVAAKLPGQLPEEIKQKRLQRLIALVRETVI